MKHLCCICLEAPGKIPPWEMDDKNNPKQPLMCPKCIGAFARVKSHSGAYVQGLLEMLAWASKRARDAEHKRMADKVKELEEKLRIEIATTDGLIRKYGTTTTEIGDMNNAK